MLVVDLLLNVRMVWEVLCLSFLHYFVSFLLLLSYGCLVTVNVLWLFLTVPWSGQQFVIMVFSDHSHS